MSTPRDEPTVPPGGEPDDRPGGEEAPRGPSPGDPAVPPRDEEPPIPPEDEGEADEDPRETPYALLQRGRELLRGRHHAQAAIVLERAARKAPGKGSILEALGRAYYMSGQHERALETFAALLEVDPSSHYAHYALGQTYKRLGRLREARTHLRLAVALDPASRLYAGALRRLGPPPEEEPPPSEPEATD
jgi:tetratricopeptide (TPR) repeat protein